jgi:hypothetical protein
MFYYFLSMIPGEAARITRASDRLRASIFKRPDPPLIEPTVFTGKGKEPMVEAPEQKRVHFDIPPTLETLTIIPHIQEEKDNVIPREETEKRKAEIDIEREYKKQKYGKGENTPPIKPELHKGGPISDFIPDSIRNITFKSASSWCFWQVAPLLAFAALAVGKGIMLQKVKGVSPALAPTSNTTIVQTPMNQEKPQLPLLIPNCNIEVTPDMEALYFA